MSRWTHVCAALIAAAVMAGCNTSTTDRPGAGGTAGTSGRAASLEGEKNFLEDVAKAGNTEVELSRLAQQRASNTAVREYAEMMVRDHTKMDEDLRQFASSNSVQLGEDATKADDSVRNRLAEKSGADFDRDYIDAMVDDHQKEIDRFADKAKGSDSPEVREWVSKNLPTLQQHLERAKEIQQLLENTKGK